MQYKKLTNSEIRIINYYVIHRDRSKAYRLGNSASSTWKDDTVVRKADEFFDSDRIQYFRGFQDGGIKVVEEDDLMTEEAMLIELDKVPAVGAHNGGGSPSKYRPEFPAIMIAFFNIGPSSVEEYINEDTGEVTRKTVTNALPTKAAFAAKLRVSLSTLNTWATKLDASGNFRYPEFAEAYEVVDAMIEDILVTNTLLGHYQSSFAQLFAKNKLKYKEKADLVLENKSGPTTSIDANMTPEEASIIYREALGQTD